jgi:hypothetical protein
VTVDEDAEDTRHRVRVDELSRLGIDRGDLDAILDVFGDARLLTFDRDPVTRGPTVEVAHEALLTQWDRLADWIDAVRDDLLTRRRISSSVREWEESSRHPSFLLRGARLEAAEAFWRSGGVPLTEAEEAYVTTSRRTAEHEAVRRRRRRRRTFTALSGALIVTLVFSVVAVDQRSVAEEQERLTRARQLGGEALVAVDADPERGILLALEALDTYHDDEGRPVAEAVSALQTALQASRVGLHLPDGFLALAISPDGGLLATDSVHDPTWVKVTDAATGDEVTSLAVADPVAKDGVAFSPDGEVLAVSYDTTDGGPAVETFDRDSWRSLDVYAAPPDSYSRLQFTDDGDHLVASATEGVVAWEVGSGDVTATLEAVQGLAVVPDSALVAVTRGDETVPPSATGSSNRRERRRASRVDTSWRRADTSSKDDAAPVPPRDHSSRRMSNGDVVQSTPVEPARPVAMTARSGVLARVRLTTSELLPIVGWPKLGGRPALARDREASHGEHTTVGIHLETGGSRRGPGHPAHVEQFRDGCRTATRGVGHRADHRCRDHAGAGGRREHVRGPRAHRPGGRDAHG